ncbi:hypothetical protein C8J57DRAFT_1528399 [Mycena rebaudengoi]|nr:hypothetical protein C8J57DRAFT_1528399 [Mycena rebaudengoi]
MSDSPKSAFREKQLEAADTQVHISIDESGEPRLPPWTDETSTADLRCLLLEFAVGIHKWYDETVPEKTDDLVIKINLKSEDATSSSSYEQFCPATMTKLQLATLYERIIEDDDRDTPLLRFLGGTPLPPAAKSKPPVLKVPVPRSGGPVDYSLPRPGASPPSSKRATVSPTPSEMSSAPPSVVDGIEETAVVQPKKKKGRPANTTQSKKRRVNS